VHQPRTGHEERLSDVGGPKAQESTAQGRHRSLRPRGAVYDRRLYSWDGMVNGCLNRVSIRAPTCGGTARAFLLGGVWAARLAQIAPDEKPGGTS